MGRPHQTVEVVVVNNIDQDISQPHLDNMNSHETTAPSESASSTPRARKMTLSSASVSFFVMGLLVSTYLFIVNADPHEQG